mmetsp:Transcript_27697/g.54098  ORF Transcript_27697/g.54098 Transcript_27697/m.54098 type:complete len:268 (+) Transcript_27697:87-890(+)
MARQLTWKHLSVEQVEEYLQLTDAPSRLSFLTAVSELPADPELAAITLDMYHYTMQFAQRRGFTADKVSVLYSMVKETHEAAMAKFLPARKAFEHFRELLLLHSVQRPPFSVGLFTMGDAKAITDFLSAGYLRHYMLYKYAFTSKTEMTFSTAYTHTESVPVDFLQPMELAEEEDAKLARLEKEELDKLSTEAITVTAEEIEQTGVPADVREKLLAAVNDKLAAAHKAMEAKFEAEHTALQNRVNSLANANSPKKTQAVAAEVQPAA